LKHFQQFLVAETPQDAVDLRKAAGTKALYIAGGTMAVPLATKSVEVLVDISRLDLAGVAMEGDKIAIGATTRLADLLSAEVRTGLPPVYDAVRKCATPIIRNMATVGGALAVAHLPSDLAVVLLAMGADLEIMRDEKAVISIEDLLAQGWLKGHDLICRVIVSKGRPGRGASFAKFGRSAIDIALVNAAVALDRAEGGRVGRLRIAVGQSYSLPVLVKAVGKEAEGKVLTRSLLEEIARSAAGSIKPKSDFRASSEYRKHLVEVMVARALYEAATQAGWKLDT